MTNDVARPDGPGSTRSAPEAPAGLRPAGDDPSRGEAHVIDGIAYVLPLYEGSPIWVKRFGRFAIGVNYRLSSFGIGVDVLTGGILLMLGPCYIWLAHIERFGAGHRDSDEHRNGEDAQRLSGEAMPARADEGGIAHD